MSEQIDEELKKMTSKERLMRTISEMRRQNAITAEQARLIRRRILENDQSLRMVAIINESQKTYEEIASTVQAYLSSVAGDEPPPEDFSPATQKIIRDAEEDSSPQDQMLLNKKIRAQTKDDPPHAFNIKLQ